MTTTYAVEVDGEVFALCPTEFHANEIARAMAMLSPSSRVCIDSIDTPSAPSGV